MRAVGIGGIRWQSVDVRHLGKKLDVVRTVPRLPKVELGVKALTSDIRQDRDSPAQEWRAAVAAEHGTRRQGTILSIVIRHGVANLLQVQLALNMALGRTHLANSRDKREVRDDWHDHGPQAGNQDGRDGESLAAKAPLRSTDFTEAQRGQNDRRDTKQEAAAEGEEAQNQGSDRLAAGPRFASERSHLIAETIAARIAATVVGLVEVVRARSTGGTIGNVPALLARFWPVLRCAHRWHQNRLAAARTLYLLPGELLLGLKLTTTLTRKDNGHVGSS